MSTPTNLLLNPGFETAGAGGADVFANWVETIGTGGVLERYAAAAHTGTYGCRIKSIAEVNQTVTTVAGEHAFRVWTYRASGLASYFTAGLYDETHGGAIISSMQISPYLERWQQFTAVVTVPAGCTSVRVRFYGPSDTASYFYFDDVQFYRVPTGQEYLLSFDWTRDGLYEDEEGERLISARIERGRGKLFGTEGEGINRDWVGDLTLELDNEDGLFDPLNASSPLYPNVLPGGPVVLQAALSDGVTYPLFKGLVTDVKGYGAVGSRKARITAVDGWDWAARAEMNPPTGVLALGKTGQAIDAALLAAEWDYAEKVLDLAGDLMDFWWSRGAVSDDGVFTSESFKTAVLDLAEASAATFFFDAQGRAVFRARTYEYQRIADVTYTEDNLEEVTVPTPWSSVRNDVRQLVSPIVQVAAQEVWSDPSLPRLIAAGGGVTLYVPVTYEGRDVAAYGYVTPVATEDFVANSSEDESGDDETANVGMSITYSKPTQATVYLSNSAAHPVWFTKARLRANVLDTPLTSVVSASDAASITRYGTHIADIKSRWQQRTANAQSVVAWYLYRGKNPYGDVTIRLAGEKGLKRDLFDRVHLDLSDTVGAHDDYLICKVAHEIRVKSLPATTLSLEVTDTRDFFLIDTDAIGGAAIIAY